MKLEGWMGHAADAQEPAEIKDGKNPSQHEGVDRSPSKYSLAEVSKKQVWYLMNSRPGPSCQRSDDAIHVLLGPIRY